MVALDGEVSNSTYADEFAKAYPDRFFEMYIAEQQLVAAAVGVGVRGYRPFASTFAAFFTRAYDFIRMAAISQANIRLFGSHAGVEIGEDGPSQMALEDLAMMRAVHGTTVLYPSDATSTAALVQAMADLDGISYLRTTRGAYPVLYDAGEPFPVGGAKVLRSADEDQVTLIGAGVTLHECLAAADQLRGRGHQRPGHRPVLGQAGRHRRRWPRPPRPPGAGWWWSRTTTPRAAWGRRARRPGRRRAHRAGRRPPRRVREMPGSGTTAELLDAAGIDAAHIAAAARRLLA